MSALFNNRYAIDPADPKGNGGFGNTIGSTSAYWTSTQPYMMDTKSALGQDFNTGTQFMYDTTNKLNVRCIRTF